MILKATDSVGICTFSEQQSDDKMNRKVITLTLLLWIVGLSNGANVFDLNFVQSTVKVVVTDYFYMLDYAIIRGVNFICLYSFSCILFAKCCLIFIWEYFR